MESFNEIWDLVKVELRNDFSEAIYNLWLKELELVSFDESEVVLAIVEFKRKIVNNKFYETLAAAFEKVLGFPIIVTLVEPQKNITDGEGFVSDKPYSGEAINENTFEGFIVGSSNKFAYSGSVTVAKDPGTAYNPLFIYGNSGLGKTHLLNAIANEIKTKHPDFNILMVNGEAFANEFILHVTTKSMAAFQNKYRNADVLLVDDVQFIAGKEAMTEEFFHTFNELTTAHKQIVLSSDRPPKEMKSFEERVRSRFESGLITDIQAPDIVTKMAIVKYKAGLLNIKMPDDVVQYIADQIKENIRQIEGVLKKLQAYVTLHSEQVNMDIAQLAIKDILSEGEPVGQTCARIIDEVARTFAADSEDIRSKKRDAQNSHLRKIAMYVINEMTPLSYKAIGVQFSNRDHSTVIYAINEIKNSMNADSSLKSTVNDIMTNVQKNQN